MDDQGEPITTGFGAGPTRREEAGALARGTMVDRYIVIDRIAAGGMGEVYAAWDAELGRRIALKVLHGEAASVGDELVLREAQALARLRHPHIVTVYDVGRYDDRLLLAMELIEAPTARAWLETEPSRSERERVFLQVAEAIAAAHRGGIIHGDLKPANILVEARETGVFARVIDFGLSRSADASTASEGPVRLAAPLVGGTPSYMAPELLDGATPDERSDQWALAVTGWELLTGHRPSPPPSLRPTSQPLEHVLLRALRDDPADRWPDVAALLSALAAGKRRRRRFAWGLAAAPVALGAGLVVALPAPPIPCDVAEPEPSSRPKDALAGLGAAGRQIEPVLTEAVETWLQRSKTTRARACHAVHVAKTHAPSHLEAVERCLHAGLIELETLLDPQPQLDVARAWKLVELARALPAPASCEEPDHQIVQSDDFEIVRLRARVERGMELGRTDPSDIEALAAALEGSHSARLVARAKLSIATGLMHIKEVERSREAFQQALGAAIATDAPDLAATVLTNLAQLEGVWSGENERADLLAELALAYVAQSTDKRLRARLEHVLSNIATTRRDDESALRHCRAGLEHANDDESLKDLPLVLRLCVADNEVSTGERGEGPKILYQEIEREALRRYGSSHPLLIATANGLAHLHMLRGQLERAEQMQRRALELQRTIYGERDIQTAFMMANLAMIRRDRGNHAERRALLEASLEVLQTNGMSSHPAMSEIGVGLAKATLATGDVEAALAIFRRTIAELPTNTGSAGLRYRVLTDTAQTIAELRPREAKALFERALADAPSPEDARQVRESLQELR